VLDGTQVRANDFTRGPILGQFERMMREFKARMEEHEVQVGLFRVPVPSVDERSFRETLVNAFAHRDYARLGAIHVRIEADAVTISNPGGFVEGVTISNILVVEPRPRNPVLADAMKRAGLAERTGRGVDLIYEGLLRYGRPEPDYSGTDTSSVVVRLSRTEADLPFLKLVLQEEARRGSAIPLDSLIVLARMRRERRLHTAEAAAAIQKSEAAARAVLERMVEGGLVEARGERRGRVYTLSAPVYRELGVPGDYVHQAGFDPIQQEQMVLRYVRSHGSIKRADVVALCRVSPDQATRLLSRLRDQGSLVRLGGGRAVSYALPKHV
jgi:ATP-dependent DNA helicase RecG